MKLTIPIIISFFLLLNISVFAQAPIANFSTATPVTGCAPMVVQFVNTSTGNPTNYSWNFGNGGTSVLASPACTYTSPGTYTITLTASNANGSNTKTMTNYITVYSAPVVNFSGTPLSSCPPLTVNFTDASNPVVPGAATYLWNFGNGTNSTQQNPSYTFTTPGYYNITLSVTNSGNCTTPLVKQSYVYVFAPPVADFTFTSVCKAPGTTTFTPSVTSGTTPYTYNWDFGDGSPLSSQSNPGHTYVSPGTYNVKLIVTDANGCKDTVIKPLGVGALNAHFTVSSSACPGSTFLFVNTSTGAASYFWDFGDGSSGSITTSPLHGFSSPGTYNVMLIAKDAANTCTDTFIAPITILTPPNAAFTVSPQYPCPAPVTINFNNTTTGAVSYTWNFGDGSPVSTATNPSHTYTANGIYTILLTATDANGCTDTVSFNDTINDLPLIINPLTGYSHCIPVTLNFSYTFNYPPGITSLVWDFGDGTPTSTLAAPTHTYTTAGDYTVVLTVTTANGCVGVDSIKLKFGDQPTANFSPANDTVCLSSLLTLSNFSTNATDFYWYYYPTAQSNPWVLSGQSTFPYSDGQYHPQLQDTLTTITLVAENNGCTDTFTYSSIRVLYPLAGADDSVSCDTPTLVRFIDTTPFPINGRTWDFGDGSPLDTSENPVHNYASLGGYSVTLTVHNDTTGCASSMSFPVYLYVPTAQFSASDTAICIGDTVYFSQQFSDVILGFGYSFTPSDAIYYPVGNFAVFPNSGIYSVMLHFEDINGCGHDTSKTNYITVGHPIINTLSIPNLGCAPLNVSILDNGANTQGVNNIQWDWDFGDNSTTTTSVHSTTHTYAPGIYDLSVIVKDNIGCMDSLVRTAYIESHQTIASFSADDTTACLNQLITFTNASSSATNTSLTYSWDFGDGSPATNIVSPTHVYTQTGAFTVKLIATDNIGCADTLIYPNYVKVAQPAASFSMDDSFALCPPLIVQFTNTSLGAATYNWSFGDGSSSTIPNPNNIYSTPGIYVIHLVAINSYGCKDSISNTVNVLGYSGGLTYTPLIGCNPITVNFTATLTNVTNFLWDFSDGTVINASGNTASHTYTNPGKYLPKMIFTDSAGCVNASNGFDTIFVDDIIADFSFSPACINTPIVLTDTSFSYFSNATSWSWDINNGQVASNLKKPTVIFPSAGNYPVLFIVSNANGCKDTLQKDLTVYPLPQISAGMDTSICVGDAATLSAAGGIAYEWSPSLTVSCDTCQTTNATPLASANYIVEGTDGNGCKSKDTVLVTVQTVTTSEVGEGGEICADSSIQLHALGAQHYIWTPSESLDDATSANPIASPDITTLYTVLAYEGSCLADTNTVAVVVHPLPTVYAGSDETIIIGNSVTLNATGGNISTYLWLPTQGLSCDICSSTQASPTATTTYTVQVTSHFGCIAKDDITVNVLCNQSQLFIPNTFSPNGDGENDVFYPRGIGLKNIRSFRIYNRWGEMIFERKNIQLNDAQNGWNGSYKGSVLSPDVFVYVLEGECSGGDNMIWRGDISLIR